MFQIQQLSPHLQGPLPKRGGLATPTAPWLDAYQALRPLGHDQAPSLAWDFHFLATCLQWGGRDLLRARDLHVVEHNSFILPHFVMEEACLTLRTAPSDAAGADGLALLTGLSLEARKANAALQSEGDAQAALELLCAQAPDSFNDLEKTTNIALFDLLQDLCLGSSQRFVRWAHTQDVIEDIKRWVTDTSAPWVLITGHTHRFWDGLSPFVSVFKDQLIKLDPNTSCLFAGLDYLRTHHPQTQHERTNVEERVGLISNGDILCVDTTLESRHVHPKMRPALQQLSQKKCDSLSYHLGSTLYSIRSMRVRALKSILFSSRE